MSDRGDSIEGVCVKLGCVCAGDSLHNSELKILVIILISRCSEGSKSSCVRFCVWVRGCVGGRAGVRSFVCVGGCV